MSIRAASGGQRDAWKSRRSGIRFTDVAITATFDAPGLAKTIVTQGFADEGDAVVVLRRRR